MNRQSIKQEYIQGAMIVSIVLAAAFAYVYQTSANKPVAAGGVEVGLHEFQSDTAHHNIEYHTCSMHPSVRSHEPGTCPICGMDLIAVSSALRDSGTIIVDDMLRQTIGVKTQGVITRAFSLPVIMQGEVAYDEAGLFDVNLHFDGWIGDVFIHAEGERVNAGDPLFTVYSPSLLALQHEYLNAKQRGKSRTTTSALQGALRKRLRLWGVSDSQIQQLDVTGEVEEYLTIYSPASGVVIEKNQIPGQFVPQGERIVRIADDTSLWVEAVVYEKDIALLRAGQMAVVDLPNQGVFGIDGSVVSVEPYLSQHAHTGVMRVSIGTDQQRVFPGGYAKVTVPVAMGQQQLVPTDAILVAGDTRVVFVDLGEGRLQPRRITTGVSDGQYTTITSGLAVGDRVVVSGNFLIAAESKLRLGVNQW